MSRRREELAQLEAAGWTILVDSPWQRGAQRLRVLAAAVRRVLVRPVGRPA